MENNIAFIANFKDLSDIPQKAIPKILKSCSNYMSSQTRKRIRDGVDVSGSAFKPVKFPELKKSPRVLYEKGDLFRSIQSTCFQTECIVFSNMPYANVHNQGAEWKPSTKQAVYLWAKLFNKQGSPFRIHHIKIDKREFLGFSDADRQRLTEIVETTLKSELGGK